MNERRYQVIASFDLSKNYGIHIKKGYAKCLSELKKDDIITSREFHKRHTNMLGKKATPSSQMKQVTAALGIGEKIGILRPVESNTISFQAFCKLDTISYLKEQLRGPQYKNLKPIDPSGLSSTQRTYLYALYKFNNWLVGKEFEFTTFSQAGADTFKKTRQKVALKGVEHLLALYRDSTQSEPDFVRMIKKYLLDAIHVHKSASSIKGEHASIMAYFEKNDLPIRFKFDARAKYQKNTEEEKQVSLEDLLHILTMGRPTVTQKAVYLCKFHRGLDAITLCDRFNFQAWEQLVSYFGTDRYAMWDLSRCPVPIKLTRIKTNYSHIGCLEHDAIVALQKYLDHRSAKTGQAMQPGEPLFLNSKGEAIREKWVSRGFFRLANTAGVQKRLDRPGAIRYEKDSHELRDLLKSTLLDSGVRPDVADHVIGHMPKDGYEKQARLYPESVRMEYSKASKRLNIFSKLSSFIRGAEDLEEMQKELVNVKTDLAKVTKRLEWAERTREKN